MPLNYNLTQLAAGLKSKQFSSVEITTEYLNNIRNLDTNYNSYISVCRDTALAQAKQADITINSETKSSAKTSPLCGIPIAHKDTFCTKGVLTSAASKILSNYISPYDATIVDRLNNSGAVTLGKTNMDEFAMGSATDTSFYGKTYNPWDVNRTAGGSSGGSAAAVAARLAVAATATDTGGSIRQPAAYCGITGIKPTYGRVSRWGMISFAPSLDQAGILCRNALDAALMLQAIAGFDPQDSTSAQQAVPDFSAKIDMPLAGVKIGVLKDFLVKLDSGVQQIFADLIAEYTKLGATIIDITVPHIDLSLPVYYIIGPAEASSNLARFDGVRYGYRCSESHDIDDLYTRTRSEALGDEVKRRIMIGTHLLSSGCYQDYYVQAQKIRSMIKQSLVNIFKNVNVILAPTTLNTAFRFDEKSTNPVDAYLEDRFTVAANLSGLPAMSIPIGMHNNLPIGAQLIGNYFTEDKLLNIAHKYQQNTSWYQAMPCTILKNKY